MIFTVTATVCACIGVLYFMSKYINYKMLINIWLVLLPILVFIYFLVRYCKRDKESTGKKISKDKDVLWNQYIVLENFYNYLQGLNITSIDFSVYGETTTVLTDKNAQELYLHALDSQEKLKEQFSQEHKTAFKKALMAYYSYISLRFDTQKIEEIKDTILNLPKVDEKVKFLVLKTFSHIDNINKEYLLISHEALFSNFTEGCYENYQIKHFYLVDGFMQWLENLLQDMQTRLIDEKDT